MARRAVWAAWAAVIVPVALAVPGCGGGNAGRASSDEPRTSPLTPDDPDRLPPETAEAIAALAAVASPDPPAGDHHGHSQVGAQEVVRLTPSEQHAFDEQWAAAAGAVASSDTVAEAEAAGYVRAAAQGAGVGVHYVQWSLIDRPFDPARPAMLLFDERDGQEGELVGFSYWLRSDVEPAGFAGPNDRWHQHHGICVVNGFVDREGATSAAICAGDYFGGADLWMLHAWVVPGWENRWGAFATMNPSLCPAAAGTPELSRCPVEDPVL
jgi:hypothetical protein